jgi:hypothetical protein
VFATKGQKYSQKSMNRGKKIRAANFEINKDQSKGKAVFATKRDAVFATKGQKYSQKSMNRKKKSESEL